MIFYLRKNFLVHDILNVVSNICTTTTWLYSLSIPLDSTLNVDINYTCGSYSRFGLSFNIDLARQEVEKYLIKRSWNF